MLIAFQWINLALWGMALAMLIPITFLLIECIAALLPEQKRETEINGIRPRIAVLVPAHNEASGIAITLETLLTQLTDADRLIAIADNCTDETAAIAKNCGATVLQRQDSERRGKGYALDYGWQFLKTDPPEVVAIVDADCIVQAGTLDQISRQAIATKRPVQATYWMQQPANPKPKDTISALAFLVKNIVRPKGLKRLGFPCLLSGTGMAFPWDVICAVPLASGNIVEDMQLGLDLAIKGYSPLFCSEAQVTGILPQQEQAAKRQRTRWEHGHLQTLLIQVPQLLKESARQKRLDLLALALELSVPPLSLLAMIWTAVFAVTLLMASLGVAGMPVILLTVEGLLFLFSILGAWAKFGRANLPILALLAVPFYVLWKMPLYLAFLVQPEKNWNRTDRDAVNWLKL